MIAAGRYNAVAIDLDFGKSKNTNTPFIAIVFRIQEAVRTTPGDERRGWSHSGDAITAFLYFTEKAAERSIQTLRKMGWGGDNVGEIIVDDVMNIMEIVVEHEVFEGKTRAKVAWINAPGESPLSIQNPLNQMERQSFSDQYRGLAMKCPKPSQQDRSIPSATGVVKQQHQRQVPDENVCSDDDIPF